MDEAIARIKTYVVLLYSTLTEEDALLDFVVRDVVDRAIAYMNRKQLAEADRLPTEVERALANTVVGACKTIKNRATSETGAVKSVSDNGQSVTYGDEIMSYVSGTTDKDLFAGTTALLDNFRLASTLELSC